MEAEIQIRNGKPVDNTADNADEIVDKEFESSGQTVETIEQNGGETDDGKYLRPKRRIGLLGAVSFGIGSIIGSGIFVSPTGALKYSGSVGMSLIMWTLSGLISIAVGLVYCELGTLLPVSGGPYMYIYKGAGSIMAFVFAFADQLFIVSSSNSVLSLVFANYLLAPMFDECGPPEVLKKMLAAAVILTLCITNIKSVKFAARTQIFFTIVKLLTITGIVVVGIVNMINGKMNGFHDSFEGTESSPTSYAMAMYSCFFALGGVHKINEIAEEIINPGRNIPLAIIISVSSVTCLYILVNVSYFTVLTKEEFVTSPAVAYQWAIEVMGPAAFVIPICVALSSYGALNGFGFAAARVWYAVARNGHFPEVLSFLHARTLIPVLSIIVAYSISILLLIPANIFGLINMVGFVSTLFGPVTILSLLRIRSRVKTRDQDRTFRVPAVVLVCAVAVEVFLIVAPFLKEPKIEFLYGVGMCVAGLLLYFPFVHFQFQVPGFNRFVVFCQLLLEVSPTAKLE